MLTFPEALSSLLFQYPTRRQRTFTSHVLPFLGGGEQRYLIVAGGPRRWEVKPTLIGEDVAQLILQFFAIAGGSGTTFAFTDPWDGHAYPACYFADDTFRLTSRAEGRAAVEFTLVEGKVTA